MSSPTETYLLKIDQLRQIYLHHPELAPYTEQLLTYVRPAISFKKWKSEENSLIGMSRYGGAPDLPLGYPYPEVEGKPCIFLAQLSLEQLSHYDISQMLPQKGLLSFFIPSLGAFEDTKLLYLEDTTSLHRDLSAPIHFPVSHIGNFDVAASMPENMSKVIEHIFQFDDYLQWGLSPYHHVQLERLQENGNIMGYPSTVHEWKLEHAVHKHHNISHQEVSLQQTLEFYRLFQFNIPYDDYVTDGTHF